MAVTPIFIFSLPRSGSTLLQRILAATDPVATSSEPWLLLPFVYASKQGGALANYWHNYAVRGTAEFIAGLPGGDDEYHEALRQFILSLYEKRADGKAYFLDKTPRYHLICEEIKTIFPDAKIIILWRNPLAVVSSMLTSWCKDKWKISLFKVDTCDGLASLLSFYHKHKADVHTMKYEDLAVNPDEIMQDICRYLQIDFNPNMLRDFSKVKLAGSLGDKSGIEKYQLLSQDSIDAWVNSFNNPFRVRWASRYLENLGEKNLETMGYNLVDLQQQLADSSKSMSLQAYVQMCGDWLYAVKALWDRYVTSKKGKFHYQ